MPFAKYDACTKLGGPAGAPVQIVSSGAHKSMVFGACSGPIVIGGAPFSVKN
jgi:hypothetical protein